jgi:hypothetical protein
MWEVLALLGPPADAVVTRLVAEVVARVDLDATVARVDLDAAAARLDVDAVVRRVDLEPILDRLDLTGIVLQRVDLESVLREVIVRLDEEELRTVASRVDVEAVLDRVDLTATVLDRVDLGRVIAAALAHIDLIALAEEIIDGVDLPEIIRESTGSMASGTVTGIRLQGIEADRAVGRAVDRLLLRHGRATDGPRS